MAKQFCTSCGTLLSPDAQQCPKCGLSFGSEGPPPSTGKTSHLAAGPQGPQTLPAFLTAILTGMVKNIKGMLKGMIIGIIVSFLLVLCLHTALLILNPSGGSSQGSADVLNMILVRAGQSSTPTILLFWLLLMGIVAFFYSQIRSKGIRATGHKLVSTPAWIWKAIRTTGITAIPLVMGGIAAALIVRMLFLTPLTSVEFLIMMFGILYSQQESMSIIALRLGYSDIYRALRKSGPAIPDAGFPAMSICGVAAGFVIGFFTADNLMLLIIVTLVLTIVGAGFALFRKRGSRPHIAGVTLLSFMKDTKGREP